MAAAYAYFIAKNHPFFDGNKRAALLCAGAFLRMNGWSMEAEGVEAADQVIALVEGRLDRDGLAAWLAAHSRALPSMELRESFARLTLKDLLTHLESATVRFDLTGSMATHAEACAAMPIVAQLFQVYEEPSNKAGSSADDSILDYCSLLTALYRIAEDMGYEW